MKKGIEMTKEQINITIYLKVSWSPSLTRICMRKSKTTQEVVVINRKNKLKNKAKQFKEQIISPIYIHLYAKHVPRNSAIFFFDSLQRSHFRRNLIEVEGQFFSVIRNLQNSQNTAFMPGNYPLWGPLCPQLALDHDQRILVSWIKVHVIAAMCLYNREIASNRMSV